MTWGVIRFEGKLVHYEVREDKVRATEVGTDTPLRSDALLAAIAADVERQGAKR